MSITWPARSWLKTWALGGGGGGARKVLENEKVVLEKKIGKNVVFKIKKWVFGPGV